LDQMFEKDRVIITAQLNLANGSFLQPTGFPDIGSCIYTDADGKRRCLIESEQSMANRLEAVCMQAPGYWVDELSHFPVIKVQDANRALLTTNLTDSHRIASSYVLESEMNGSDVKTKFTEKLGLTDGGSSWPLDKRDALDKLVFALDPAAMLHGFQFVQWTFVGLRQTRLLSSRLECVLAEEPEVHYAMVKFDPIEPNAHPRNTNKGQSIAAKSRVVPAKDGIKATFDIDVLSLKSLALDDNQKKFLLALALWKVGAFLSNKRAFDARSRQTTPSLRLRADCYLSCGQCITWAAPPAEEMNSVKPGDLMTVISEFEIDFKQAAANQGFEFKPESNGKQLSLIVTYKKGASAQPAAPGISQEDEAQTLEN
jgi:CRISPR-associated protein Csb1